MTKERVNFKRKQADGEANFEVATPVGTIRLLHLCIKNGWVDARVYVKTVFETKEQALSRKPILEKKNIGSMTMDQLIEFALSA